VLQLGDFATALGHEVITAGRDTDVYLQARRTRRLTLAAEMQWQLLPGGGCAREEYVIGAHLEPAYAIGGDNFDWSTSADHLVLTMTDGMGQGINASLLTSLAVSALRNARRADIALADQACLADQAVYAQYGGKVYASTLLLRFDLATGTVSAVDAGSPQLFRQRDGRTERIELTAQLPLGMFEETLYEEQTFQVRPGDRLIAVSTGVHGTRSAMGDLFGERALRQVLSATRPTTPHETARAIVAALVEHYGSSDLASDAAVVCLDWNGPRD
jgi:serine phosphatase RsbU (regulator of sigma subunit)